MQTVERGIDLDGREHGRITDQMRARVRKLLPVLLRDGPTGTADPNRGHRTGSLIPSHAHGIAHVPKARAIRGISTGPRAIDQSCSVHCGFHIHRSRMVQAWLIRHPRVKLLFQPVHHPWAHAIERLWKQMHDTITRNHRCGTMDKLINNVDRFMEVCQPFPGSRPALTRAA